MDYQQLRAILRSMAWQRAKGELNSMLETLVNENVKFIELSTAIHTLIGTVEDNELDK